VFFFLASSTVQYSIVKGIMTLDQSANDEQNAGASCTVPYLRFGRLSGWLCYGDTARGVKSNKSAVHVTLRRSSKISRIFGTLEPRCRYRRGALEGTDPE
jgi:hypothetical protein